MPKKKPLPEISTNCAKARNCVEALGGPTALARTLIKGGHLDPKMTVESMRIRIQQWLNPKRDGIPPGWATVVADIMGVHAGEVREGLGGETWTG